MSIKIGNTITNPNNFTNKERVSLSSVNESNLIIMQSQFSDVNISLFSGQDNNCFTLGKSSDVFKITENNSAVASLSLTCNIFYSPTYLNNSLSVEQSINIGTTLSANALAAKSIVITPLIFNSSNSGIGGIGGSSNNNYFLASNTNGLLMSANANGFVNIIGNVNIGLVSSNSRYSLMVDSNVSIGNTLTVPTITATTVSSTSITGTNRISGKNTNAYIDFGSGNNGEYLQFNSFVSGQPSACTQLNGNFTVNGTIFANDVQTLNPATNISILKITSNITTASATIVNTPNIIQPSLLINHTNYSNVNILDINLFTFTSNYDTNSIVTNRVDAFSIDHVGRVKIGGTHKTSSLFSVQTTINNEENTSNLFSLIGNDSNNNIIYINNTADVGIGTNNPTSRLHILQCYADNCSNSPLVALYAQSFSTSNNEGSNVGFISDIIAGYSNNINVFYVNSTGDITGNNFITSNNVYCHSMNASIINANNPNNTINYNNNSLVNINSLSINTVNTSNINTSSTINTRNIITHSINTSNLFIPNLSIFNDMGYYAVYTQQLWFTGSNIVMSSLNSDRIADSSQGKLVVRTDDQKNVTGNAVGLNAIGTQQSSIRITSLQQPNYEMFGPNTTTYFGATKTSSAYGANMFYISHLLNQSSGTGCNVGDNPYYAQFRITRQISFKS
jgi:hypothetical protein